MIIFNYTVNYIDILLVLLLLLFIVIGYCRGLLINVVNFIRWAVGLFLCFFFGEKLALPLYESYVKPRALEYINEKIVTSTNLDEVLKNIQGIGEKLPSAVADSVDFSKLSVSSGDIAKSILENYFEGILIFLVKAAVFIAVFALFFLITGIIILAVQRNRKKRDKKRGRESALKKTDRVLGAVLGLLKGAIAVFAVSAVLMLVINLYDDTEQMSSFIKQASNSQLLKLIDEINPFNAITGGIL